MALLWRRAVLLLVIVIAVLQVIHMTLLSRLESKRSERRKRGSNGKMVLNENDAYIYHEYDEQEIDKDRQKMLESVKDSTVLDSSGEYHIINFLQRANSFGSRKYIRQDISLITQSSVSQLYHLELISNRWFGLISVAVFSLPQDIPLAIEAILHLRRCSPSIRHNTSFHLVYPLSIPPPAIGATTLSPRLSVDKIAKLHNCNDIKQLIQSLTPGVLNYAHSGVQYPNNLLRNVARRNALTEFVFVIDIDLVPSDKLQESFIEFAKENKLFLDNQKEDKIVYVVPAYEVKTVTETSASGVSHDNINDFIPRDKMSLLELIDLMEARPFYIELCLKCQKYTDYETWQKEPPSSKLAVLFEVLWRDPWEPFYISRNNVPLYDERFRQYGFNRISQVCELHMAGYKFSVLNKAFVIHKGLKTADSFHKEKDLEQERNRALFRQFKTELKQRYPDSSRRCY